VVDASAREFRRVNKFQPRRCHEASFVRLCNTFIVESCIYIHVYISEVASNSILILRDERTRDTR